MKIGIDASRYDFNQATGVEWYSFHIINELLNIFDEKDEIILYSRKKIKRLPSQKNIKNKIISGNRFWTLWHLSKEIKKNPPDILFVPSHTLPLTLPKKTITTIHDTAFKHLKSVYSPIEYFYLNFSTKRAVKHANKIIVPSEATAKDLIKLYNCPKEKISVILHGFTPPKPQEEEKDDFEMLKYFKINEKMKYALFVGRLESKKNLIRLIQSFNEFLKTHPDYKLILAGKRGVGFKELLNEITKLNILDKIIMPGYITEKEKDFLYKNCQFFVFPSLYEGFGLPLLEAFYYKKPVLCSKSSSLPEVGKDCVLYANPYDVNSITEGLLKLAKKNQVYENLINKSQERLKDFSWKKSSKETLKLFHE